MFKKNWHKGDPKVLIKCICLQTFSQEEYVKKKSTVGGILTHTFIILHHSYRVS